MSLEKSLALALSILALSLPAPQAFSQDPEADAATVAPEVTWPTSGPGWREIDPPPTVSGRPSTSADRVWIEIDAPNRHRLRAAVFRPAGEGPFPVLVAFPGGHGLPEGYGTLLGTLFRDAGFMVVTGCWYRNSVREADPAQTPGGQLACPDAPDLVDGACATCAGGGIDFHRLVLPYGQALADTARQLPGSDGLPVFLFGASRGGGMITMLASTGTETRGVVSDSGDYQQTPSRTVYPLALAHQFGAPILLLHGARDALVPIAIARDYEAALRRAGKDIEAVYYEGQAHGVYGTVPPENYPNMEDAHTRALAFLAAQLARSQEPPDGT